MVLARIVPSMVYNNRHRVRAKTNRRRTAGFGDPRQKNITVTGLAPLSAVTRQHNHQSYFQHSLWMD